MPSRTPSRTGRAGRSAPAPSSNATAMLFGGIAVVVVIVLFVVMSRGGGKDPADGANAAAKSPAPPPVTAPPAAPASTGTFAAKPGKPPARTAPPLAQALLDQCTAKLAEAKQLSNDGVRARNAGDADLAGKKQSAAAAKLDEIKKLTAEPWRWQEEAELGDWALPAEYVALGRLYDDVSKLEKQVRMGAGKR